MDPNAKSLHLLLQNRSARLLFQHLVKLLSLWATPPTRLCTSDFYDVYEGHASDNTIFLITHVLAFPPPSAPLLPTAHPPTCLPGYHYRAPLLSSPALSAPAARYHTVLVLSSWHYGHVSPPPADHSRQRNIATRHCRQRAINSTSGRNGSGPG